MHIIKMHSYGNDYAVSLFEKNLDYSIISKKICDRRFSLGALGLILIKQNPFEILYYDRFGNKKEPTGDMYLCYSLYVKLNNLARRGEFDVSYLGRTKNIMLENEDIVINYPQPNFNNSMLYINDCLDSYGRILKINGVDITIFCMNVTSVRCVIFVDSFEDNVLNFAKDISTNQLFRRGINVDFVKIIDRKNIKVKSYEYNIGFKFSAEGNVAAVIAANKNGYTYKTVEVENEFGKSLVDTTKKIIRFVGNAYKNYELDI